jgi:hypothetical protein
MRSRSGFARPCICFLIILMRFDVAFDGAGAVGDGESGGDGGPVAAQSPGEAAQFADRAGLGLGGPGFQVLAVAVAEHLGGRADQVPGGCEFLAAAGDPGERGTVTAGEAACGPRRRGPRRAGPGSGRPGRPPGPARPVPRVARVQGLVTVPAGRNGAGR